MDAHRDRALQESVRCRLMEDTRVAGMPLSVVSTGGHIQITGIVDTEEQHLTAIDLARGVSGVRQVEDRIEVRRQAA